MKELLFLDVGDYVRVVFFENLNIKEWKFEIVVE